MGWKSKIMLPVATLVARKIRRNAKTAVQDQEKLFTQLIQTARNTAFGKDHDFSGIKNINDYRDRVSAGDYEQIRPYIDRIIKGEKDVLWPERPQYFAKTSGTTSGVKYIPISKDSAPHHVNSARNALFCFVEETRDASVFDGAMIFLSGSPILDKTGDIPTGRLSGIVNHHIPAWIRKHQLPSWETNCMEDWEEKVIAIVRETSSKDLRLIGGIPSWVQMYFDRLLDATGKRNIKEIFPNLSVYVYGGVNYSPYRKKFEETLGSSVKTIETYPASEGFIAFQDRQDEPGLLLQTWVGIFYEFIPLNRLYEPNPPRLSLAEVKTGEQYAILLTTNAGLWSYLIGDTVKFVSTNPYRIVVTGRTKHFISAFGEHVIAEEVEGVMQEVLEHFNASVREFHVAPLVNPTDGNLPGHDWLVEFDTQPENLDEMAAAIDLSMRKRNPYYDDLISGGILRPVRILPLRPGTFGDFMKSQGKLGGQNKVIRLADNRNMAEELLKMQF